MTDGQERQMAGSAIARLAYSRRKRLNKNHAMEADYKRGGLRKRDIQYTAREGCVSATLDSMPSSKN